MSITIERHLNAVHTVDLILKWVKIINLLQWLIKKIHNYLITVI